MDMESDENLPSDISQFLDRFEKDNSELERAFTAGKMNSRSALDAQDRASKTADKEHGFKKLEEKIFELEKKFENSLREKEFLLNELAKAKNEPDAAKMRDEFYNNIALTISNLRDSVDRLNRAQPAPQRPAFMPQTEVYGQGYYYGAPIDQASKIGQEEIFKARQEAQKYAAELVRTKDELSVKQTALERQTREIAAKQDVIARQERELAQRREAEITQVGEMSSKQTMIDGQRDEIALQNQTIAAQKTEITRHAQTVNAQKTELARQKAENEERERLMTGLKEKASRLKAVNSALEKEFKRAQEEKLSALKKSAEQAKEILSLRDALTKAEEGFKSFDFEGRVMSVENKYKQKISTLETQLQEVSAVCMRQVEEIENLKTESALSRHFETETAALRASLENKDEEIALLKNKVEDAAKNSQELLLNLTTSSSKNNEEFNARLAAAQKMINARLESARAAFKQKEAQFEQISAAKIREAELKAEAKAEEAEKAAAARVKEIAHKAGQMEQNAARRINDITQKAESEIAALNARLLAAQSERDAVSGRLKTLSAGVEADAAEKSGMQETFKALMSKIKENDAVIEGLKNKIAVLDGENKDLRKRTHSNYLEKKAAMEGAPASVPAPAAKTQDISYPDPAARKRSHAAIAALGKAEAKKDFLEDTQTFFGRMKWSLLKDD